MRAAAGIASYFEFMVISEEIGVAKPDPRFFEIALAMAGNPDPREVLVIGDSLTSDIQGGIAYGLDTCWYNPVGEPRPEGLAITHEIGQLGELLEMLD